MWSHLVLVTLVSLSEIVPIPTSVSTLSLHARNFLTGNLVLHL